MGLRRTAACFGLLILLLPALVLSWPRVEAALKFQAYATWDGAFQAEDGTKLPGAVRWWYSKREDTYVFFMPGGTESLRLWFEGAGAVETENGLLCHGDRADFLLDGETHILKEGKRKYTVRAMRSSRVPSLFMTTRSGSLDYIHRRKGNEENGFLLMRDPEDGVLYDGALSQIKGRGNATFVLHKKPYQIKLEKATDLCGMGRAKTWILLADFHDNSLLRNRLALDLARKVGLAYTSLAQTVDVYINHDYLGAYLLCEKVEIGKTRVDIADLGKQTRALNEDAPDAYRRVGPKAYTPGTFKGYDIPRDPRDISGGYLLEMDYSMRYVNEASGFVTKRGQAVVIKEPKFASRAQAAYISAFFQGFENAVRAKDGIDPETGKHFTEFVDLTSMVKKYLVEEVLKNRDANRSSLYFYKPPDSVSPIAFMGPVWDYDAALGNFAPREGDRVALPEYFCVNNDTLPAYHLFPALYRHPSFREAVRDLYHRDFVPALRVLLGEEEDPDGILLSVEAYADGIRDCAAMNFVRWPVFNIKARLVRTGADYQENIDYLTTFLRKRMAFLEREWPSP